MSGELTVSLVCVEEAAAREIAESFPAQASVANPRSLDGGAAAEWVVIATATLRALRLASDTILRLVELRRVKYIRIGDSEVGNPTRAQADELIKGFATTPAQGVTVTGADPPTKPTEPPLN